MKLVKLFALALIVAITFSSCTVTASAQAPRARVVAVKLHNPKVVVFKKTTYYHENGKWYKKRNGKYVFVKPPVGITIRTLPKGYKVVTVGKKRYYTCHGVYYVKHGSHFKVVKI